MALGIICPYRATEAGDAQQTTACVKAGGLFAALQAVAIVARKSCQECISAKTSLSRTTQISRRAARAAVGLKAAALPFGEKAAQECLFDVSQGYLRS